MIEGKARWIPQSVPQWLAVMTQADRLYYGGSAGGGKTDLALGLAVTAHKRSLILRRESTQLRGIIDRSHEIIGSLGRFNENLGVWRNLPGNKQIEFAGCKDERDKRKFQGRPHDLVVFDEAPEFLESQVVFIVGWARTEDVDQRVRIVYTGNPPMSAEGRWIVEKFAPWLDDKYPNPAEPGELRYFAVIDGEEVWVGGPQRIEHGDEIIKPLSRTFIPARVRDNPFYMATGYEAQLQALPEPLRSQLLYGDFDAGQGDNPWQVIPSKWIRLAQARWEERERPDTPLSAVGVDVARGGDDQTVIAKCFDNWIDELQRYPGKLTIDGPSVAALAIEALGKDIESLIGVDVIGVGSSVYDSLVSQDLEVIGVNFAKGTKERDKSGQLAFKNVRAEAYWRLRESLDPNDGDDLALPPDNELFADLTAPKWKMTPSGIQIESKEDIKKRLGRSTDCGDAVAIVLYCVANSGPWIIEI